MELSFDYYIYILIFPINPNKYMIFRCIRYFKVTLIWSDCSQRRKDKQNSRLIRPSSRGANNHLYWVYNCTTAKVWWNIQFDLVYNYEPFYPALPGDSKDFICWILQECPIFKCRHLSIVKYQEARIYPSSVESY